jgi:hypothetical protein
MDEVLAFGETIPPLRAIFHLEEISTRKLYAPEERGLLAETSTAPENTVKV